MVKSTKTERHIISILTKNQPGVLSRIAGLFSRRGYNIDGLTVCATENENYSRMTVTVDATDWTANQIVEQLKKQIERIDKDRQSYYEFYTGKRWGVKENYDLMLNTTDIEIKEVVPHLAKIF